MTGPPAGPPRPGAERSRVPEALARGWGRAALHALLAFVVLLALGEVLAALQASTDPFRAVAPSGGIELPELSVRNVLRAGGLAFFQFHMVTTEVSLPPIRGPEAFPFGLSLSLSFAGTAMGAMALGGWLLFVGGRSVAAREGGPTWARVLHGAKVAVPYAVLALLLAFVVRQDVSLTRFPGAPFGDGVATIRPRPMSAFLWPLLLGLVAGGLGGLRSALGSPGWHPWGQRGWAALAGGWTMAWLALGLSFVGLLVLAAVHPDATRTYFEIVGRLGGAGGTLLVLTTVLFLPNLATSFLAGSMGGAAVSVGFFGSACTVISYGRFPRGVAGAVPPPDALAPTCESLLGALRFGTAPAWYFSFLLVPLVASVVGGWVAARRAGATTSAEGAGAGAAAGTTFALILLGLLVVGRFVAQAEGLVGFLTGGGSVSVGPGVGTVFLLGLGWGLAGGALGGTLGAGRPAPGTGGTGFEPGPDTAGSA
ncbi:MAG: hypothetical protein ACRDI0_10465 [Actinomycetota bacterium]